MKLQNLYRTGPLKAQGKRSGFTIGSIQPVNEVSLESVAIQRIPEPVFPKSQLSNGIPVWGDYHVAFFEPLSVQRRSEIVPRRPGAGDYLSMFEEKVPIERLNQRRTRDTRIGQQVTPRPAIIGPDRLQTRLKILTCLQNARLLSVLVLPLKRS